MDITSVGAASPISTASGGSDAVQVNNASGFDGLKGLFEVTCNGNTQLMTAEQLGKLQSAMESLNGTAQTLRDSIDSQQNAIQQILQNLR